MRPWVPTIGAIEAAYDLLLQMPPFARYKLPRADDVEFHVVSTTSVQGEWWFNGKHHVLRVSAERVSTLDRLLQVMAHEMCHLVVHECLGGERAEHGPKFNRLARSVCRWHRWDEKEFAL